jgi:hypothetical protein
LINILLFRYANFKKVLVEHFKRKNEDKEMNERYVTETYARLSAAWNKKVTLDQTVGAHTKCFAIKQNDPG